jgi:hypothetical protein
MRKIDIRLDSQFLGFIHRSRLRWMEITYNEMGQPWNEQKYGPWHYGLSRRQAERRVVSHDL